MTTAAEMAPPPGSHFAPLHYLSEAAKILSWDDEAVRRASRDNNSLLYGFLIVAIAPALPFGSLLLREINLGYLVPRGLIASRDGIVLLYSLLAGWAIACAGEDAV
jgi:hypothetical protein